MSKSEAGERDASGATLSGMASCSAGMNCFVEVGAERMGVSVMEEEDVVTAEMPTEKLRRASLSVPGGETKMVAECG